MATILLVPGAWFPPPVYQPFLQALEAAGYDARYASYPSLDPRNPSIQDCQADTEVLTAALRPIIEEEGKDVILLLHSYAGMPGAAAAVGLSKSQRQGEGNAGGVLGLLFIAAFVVPEGLSCAGLQGGQLPPWVLLDKPSAGLNVPDDAARTFAADMNPELVSTLISALKPHSTLSFNSPQPHPAFADEAFHGRLAFIVTTNDIAVPKDAQFAMMAATQQNWIVREMTSSHCAPFFDQTHETIKLIQEIVRLYP